MKKVTKLIELGGTLGLLAGTIYSVRVIRRKKPALKRSIKSDKQLFKRLMTGIQTTKRDLNNFKTALNQVNFTDLTRDLNLFNQSIQPKLHRIQSNVKAIKRK